MDQGAVKNQADDKLSGPIKKAKFPEYINTY
jgi:hypothetical protein